jgi:hypothetical protein
MQSFEAQELIGFSTGALAKADWKTGLQQSRDLGLKVIELSALRYAEFGPLAAAAIDLDLSDFTYIAVHVPSAYAREDEIKVLKAAEPLAKKKWRLILHPDAIFDWRSWREFGELICLENMDKRKPVGRAGFGLEDAFEQLPDARLCFDYGHAKQVDPTMSRALHLLTTLGHKLEQVHFSDVDSTNHHRLLNYPALEAFARVRPFQEKQVPVILETPVSPSDIKSQLLLATEFFCSTKHSIPA